MSFVSKLLTLPEKLLLALFAFLALLVVSLVSTWFPGIGNWFWGAGLVAVAIFLPPVVLFKSKKYNVTVGSIAALLGIAIIVFNLLAVNLPSFGFTIVQVVSQPTAQSIAAMALDGGEAMPVSLDLTTVLVATVGAAVGAIVGQEYILRKRRK